MVITCPNFWNILPEDYEYNHTAAVLITLAILGFGVFRVWKKGQTDYIRLLKLAAWSCWTCVMFLPSMHDRYTYPVDITLLILSFVSRDRKIAVITFVECLMSLLAYRAFLQGPTIDYLWPGIINMVFWAWFSVLLFDTDGLS